jgi:hypothetical protein
MKSTNALKSCSSAPVRLGPPSRWLGVLEVWLELLGVLVFSESLEEFLERLFELSVAIELLLVDLLEQLL